MSRPSGPAASSPGVDPGPGTGGARQKRRGELVLRILSSLALGPLTLVILWFGGPAFTVLIALVGVLVWCEWITMVAAGRDRVLLGGGAAVLVAALAAVLAAKPFAAAGLLVAGALAVALLTGRQSGAIARRGHAAGRPSRRTATRMLLAAAGVFYAALPAISLVVLRGESYGRVATFLLMLVVWTTDIAAYAGGRAIGGPRLWRAVSPNKTWSGALSGVFGAVLMALGVAAAAGLPAGLAVAAIGAVLSVGSQIGDLIESAAKRALGVKDSGNLLPGHGGFLDRVDGLMAAAVLALVLSLPALLQHL